MKSTPPSRISRADVLAGLSVALVLVPQSMAYAELAGLPSHHGLYAATLPLIAAAFFASSPYLQTGPVALTGLLTFGALVQLAPTGTAEYAGLAAVLAVVVGVARLVVGMLKAGWVVYLMSHAMMAGFLSAAAILIISSQLPGALGLVPGSDGNVIVRAWVGLSNPGGWDLSAIGLAVATIGLVIGASKIHPLLPGVLIAAALGVAMHSLTGRGGPTVGGIPSGLPPFSTDLPWDKLPALIVPGIVISVVGFAEGVSISRVLASEARQHWDADMEFISKGIGNVVAGLTAGLPVGGSLSRTSLNRLAGAESRWSGLVTGLAVLVFLPFASVLESLPRAVLSGIVIAAIWKLVRPRQLVRLLQASPLQGFVALLTFGATLALAPRVDRAILIGIGLSAAVHLWRELRPEVTSSRVGDTLRVELSGVLWFGSAPALEARIFEQLADEPDVTRVELNAAGLGRIDLSGAYTLAEMLEHAKRADIEMTIENIPEHARVVLQSVGVGLPSKAVGERSSEQD